MIKSVADIGGNVCHDYPILKNVKDSKWRIVLFTAPKTGVIVKDGSDGDFQYRMGHYSEKWAEDDFEVYNGTIMLSNCG